MIKQLALDNLQDKYDLAVEERFENELSDDSITVRPYNELLKETGLESMKHDQYFLDILKENQNRIQKKKTPEELVQYLIDTYECAEVDEDTRGIAEQILLYKGNIDYYRKVRGLKQTGYCSKILEVKNPVYYEDFTDYPEFMGRVLLAVDMLTGYVNSNAHILGFEMILAKGLAEEDTWHDKVTYAITLIAYDSYKSRIDQLLI